MRVTQFMLANSNLKYISQSYNSLSKLQDQLNTGKKITRPSDDPVVAMKGMRYRTQLVEVKQFSRNLGEGFNWMENADSSLEEVNQVLQRIRELVVQASNDTYEVEARSNIAKEISRLQEHIVALANTKVGENYIFNGTDTASAPIDETLFNIEFSVFKNDITNNGIDPGDYVISYKGQTYKYDADKSSNNLVVFKVLPEITYNGIDSTNQNIIPNQKGSPATLKIDLQNGNITHTVLEEQEVKEGQKAMIEISKEITEDYLVFSRIDGVSTNNQRVEIEVMKGVRIPINIEANRAFTIDMFSGLESIKKMLTDPTATGEDITKSLDYIDKYLNDVVAMRAELGAQINRAEMVESRLLELRTVAEKTISDNEDIDFEEVIINLTIQQTLHRASLASGARIVQPTLMDFLR